MTVKLTLKNCSDALLDVIFDAIELDGKAKMKVRYPDEEYLRPEVEAEIDRDLAELEEQRKNGTARTYKDVYELMAAFDEVQDKDDNELRKVS